MPPTLVYKAKQGRGSWSVRSALKWPQRCLRCSRHGASGDTCPRRAPPQPPAPRSVSRPAANHGPGHGHRREGRRRPSGWTGHRTTGGSNGQHQPPPPLTIAGGTDEQLPGSSVPTWSSVVSCGVCSLERSFSFGLDEGQDREGGPDAVPTASARTADPAQRPLARSRATRNNTASAGNSHIRSAPLKCLLLRKRL